MVTLVMHNSLISSIISVNRKLYILDLDLIEFCDLSTLISLTPLIFLKDELIKIFKVPTVI
jgi:hypothetical protein